MLTFEDRAAAIGQTQFAAKLLVRLIVIMLLDLFVESCNEPRSQQLHVTHPGPKRRQRRIISRHKRTGSEHARYPGYTCLLRDQGTSKCNGMGQQQVCALDGPRKIFITVTDKR